jgi:hypothetical protein
VSQHTEQAGLHGRRHVADLIEKNRPAVGGFEKANLILHRPGERPLAMPEELTLQQRFRQRGAVDGDERPLRPLAGAMDAARHQLFAGAGLAFDQHRDSGRGGAVHQTQHLAHRRTGSDDVAKAVAAGQVAPQGRHLHPQLLFGRLEHTVAARVLDRHRHSGRERIEKSEVVIVERKTVGTIHYFEHADGVRLHGQRRG